MIDKQTTNKFYTYKVYNGPIQKIFQSSKNKIINTINTYSFVIAEKDKYFSEALVDSDILACDGSGIEFAIRLFTKKKTQRITGYDIFIEGLKMSNSNINNKVFLFGSSLANLKIIKTKIEAEFPKVKCKYLSPAYKEKFSDEENSLYINEINTFSPDILFVSLTAPKQEKWSFDNKNKLNANHIASVGAVFDFYSGNIKRAPKFFQLIGMEWLYRSISEPKRLGSRNLYAIPNFILITIKKFLKNEI